MAHDQLARFQEGKPILIVINSVKHREALQRGRRRKDALELNVHEALVVRVYVGVERLCAWLKVRDRRRMDVAVSELRDRTFELLASEAWLEDPKTTGPMTEERDKRFFEPSSMRVVE